MRKLILEHNRIKALLHHESLPLFVAVEARPYFGGQVIPLGGNPAVLVGPLPVAFCEPAAKLGAFRARELSADGAIDKLTAVTFGDDTIEQTNRSIRQRDIEALMHRLNPTTSLQKRRRSGQMSTVNTAAWRRDGQPQ